MNTNNWFSIGKPMESNHKLSTPTTHRGGGGNPLPWCRRGGRGPLTPGTYIHPGSPRMDNVTEKLCMLLGEQGSCIGTSLRLPQSLTDWQLQICECVAQKTYLLTTARSSTMLSVLPSQLFLCPEEQQDGQVIQLWVHSGWTRHHLESQI